MLVGLSEPGVCYNGILMGAANISRVVGCAARVAAGPRGTINLTVGIDRIIFEMVSPPRSFGWILSADWLLSPSSVQWKTQSAMCGSFSRLDGCFVGSRRACSTECSNLRPFGPPIQVKCCASISPEELRSSVLHPASRRLRKAA